MPSSLVPEKPLLIYPSLAATLGLEESLLLCVLADQVQTLNPEQLRGFDWYSVETQTLLDGLPFWQLRDLQRIANSLRDKGVIIVSTHQLEQGGPLRFAFNEKAEQSWSQRQQRLRQPDGRTQQVRQAVPPSPGIAKNFISPNWQPDRNTLEQLAQHRIPDSFARQLVPEFITYWRERGEQQHSWGAKFMQHVLRKWRDYETLRFQQEQEGPIQQNWQPSADAMEILVDKGGIRREFVEDAVPEFILYWRERGDSHRTWNTKFVQHVRVQWAKFTAAIENNTEPRPIPANWQPSEDVYDVLRLANIDVQFARSLLPEFVLYWRDRGILLSSWNTKFLQHTKRQWAQRHDAPASGTQAANRSTRDMHLEEELNDRSWAN